MRGRIGDAQRILHIEEAIKEIEGYIQDIDINKFKSNSMVRFASIKQIEIYWGSTFKLITGIQPNYAALTQSHASFVGHACLSQSDTRYFLPRKYRSSFSALSGITTINDKF